MMLLFFSFLFDTNCLIIISLYLVVSCAAYASDIKSGVRVLSYVRACSCVVFVSDIKRGCSVICDEIAYKCKKDCNSFASPLMISRFSQFVLSLFLSSQG